MGLQALLSLLALETVLLLPLSTLASLRGGTTNAENSIATRMELERRIERQLQQAPQPISITAGPTENETVSRNDFPVLFQVPGNANTECLLSRGPITVRDWFQCTSPLALPEVMEVEGRYTLRIRLVAEPTMAAQSEAVVSFFMDLTEPDTEIISAVDDPDDATNYLFEFIGIGDDVDFFECELDRRGYWERCQSPKIYRGLVYGEHIFAVRAVDIAGNVDSSPATELFEIENPFLSPSPVLQQSPPSEVSPPVDINSVQASRSTPPASPSDAPRSFPSPSFVEITNEQQSSPSLPLASSPFPSVYATSSDVTEESETATSSFVAVESPEVGDGAEEEDSSGEEEGDPGLDFGAGRKNQMQGTVVVKEFTPDSASALIVSLASAFIAVLTIGIVVFYCSRGSRLTLRGGYSLI